MSNIKIISVVGARPNFMKIAPFIKAIESFNAGMRSNCIPASRQEVVADKVLSTVKSEFIDHILVHTGQHYDVSMSEAFFKELDIPDPDINLEIGSGSHAEQLGYTMVAFEKVLIDQKPDWVVVVGDVNATLSCSVTAKKLGIKVCHIEAGLRSGDISMPEEINRLVTDRIADLLLTPDEISSDNLRKEGTPENRIIFTGNIMIDTLEANREKAKMLTVEEIVRRKKLIKSGFYRPVTDGLKYAVVTLHRPSNVDSIGTFEPIIEFLIKEVCSNMTLIWPVHPRALKQLRQFGILDKVIPNPSVFLLEPVSYLDMLRLNMGASIMLTDSGGLQEECCVLGTPCLTLRYNTERPVTLKEYGGASVLVGNNIERIRKEFFMALNSEHKPKRPALWDGHAAERCLQAILDFNK